MIKKQLWWCGGLVLINMALQAGDGFSKPGSSDAPDVTKHAVKTALVSATVYVALRGIEWGIRSMMRKQRTIQQQKNVENQSLQPQPATSLINEDTPQDVMRRARLMLVHAQGQEARTQGQEARIQRLERAYEKDRGENSVVEQLRREIGVLKKEQQQCTQHHATTKQELIACRTTVDKESNARGELLGAASSVHGIEASIQRLEQRFKVLDNLDISDISSSSLLSSSSSSASGDTRTQVLHLFLLQKFASLEDQLSALHESKQSGVKKHSKKVTKKLNKGKHAGRKKQS